MKIFYPDATEVIVEENTRTKLTVTALGAVRIKIQKDLSVPQVNRMVNKLMQISLAVKQLKHKFTLRGRIDNRDTYIIMKPDNKKSEDSFKWDPI